MSLVTPDEILDFQRYDESEMKHVKSLIMGAEAFLKGAGAYDVNNELTKVVISLIVGLWLDNREGNIADYKEVGDFPLALQGLILNLRYNKGSDKDEQKSV